MIKHFLLYCICSTALAASGTEKYEFSTEWFSPVQPLFEKYLKQPEGPEKPIKYLELGLYEGRSFTWVMDNSMTHPQSRAVGIDLFDSTVIEDRFRKNLSKTAFPAKAEILKGSSQEVMRKLDGGQFDFIYVDAGHTAYETIVDLTESFRLAKPGGLIIVDDYSLFEDELPAYLRPKLGIDSFLQSYRTKVEVIEVQNLVLYGTGKPKTKKWGIAIKKLQNPCDNMRVNFKAEGNVYQQCSRLSDESYYLWTDKKVYAAGKPIDITKKQTVAVEEFLKSLENVKPLESKKLPRWLEVILDKHIKNSGRRSEPND